MSNPAWVKGVSGNPSGRPAEKNNLPALCRKFTHEAVDTAVRIMRNPDDMRSLQAAQWLMDRGYGKAPVVLEGADANTLTALHLIAARQIADQMQLLIASGTKPNGHANGNGATIDGDAVIDYTKPALE